VKDEATLDPKKNLFQALTERVQISDALLIGSAHVKPLSLKPQAWASKSASNGSYSARLFMAKEILRHSKAWLHSGKVSSWHKESVTSFSLVSGKLKLYQAGKLTDCGTRETYRLGRLDLLYCEEPSQIQHLWLGTIDIEAGKAIAVWQLPNLLSKEANQKIDQAISLADRGDVLAQGLLQLSMPFCHKRIYLFSMGSSKFRSAADPLRMLRTNFDDLIPNLGPKFEPARAINR
jgi:hypothetical protein